MLDLSNKRNMYNIYNLPKGNGSFRKIYSPNKELKLEQLRIKDQLESIYNPPDCAFGYINGRNCSSLASRHIGNDYVITIDIKGFFESITKEHCRKIGLNEYDIEIATLGNKCVTGSPCTPVISNLLLRECDIKFETYFKSLDVQYSRYVDDLVISGNGKPSWKMIKYIEDNLREIGFKLNKDKIKFMFKNEHQEVLGICVNTKISINKKVRSQLKFRASRGILTYYDIGYLSYVNSISPEQYSHIISNE